MKRLCLLLLIAGSLNCYAQDKPVVISNQMFDPVFDVAPLGPLEGWYFRLGSDTSWAKADINMAGWQKLSPVDLSAKYAGKDGTVECWFRIKLKLDDLVKKKGLAIFCGSFAPADIYINGKHIGSVGNTGLYGHPYTESTFTILKPWLPVDIKSGEQFTLALHLVDSVSPLPPRKLKWQVRPGSSIIGLGSSDAQGLIIENYMGLNENYMLCVGVCLSLSVLFWLMLIQNRRQRVYLYIAVWTTMMVINIFIGALQIDLTGIGSLLYLVYDAVGNFTFVLMVLMTPVIMAEVFKRRLRYWVKIVLAVIAIYSLFATFLPGSTVTLIIGTLFLTALNVYYIISSWKTLRGAQWTVVTGLLAVLLSVLLDIVLVVLFPGHIYSNVGIGYFLNTCIILAFPISLLVFVAMRFREMLREVKQNADEVVHLSEEKKEEALNRQKLLEEEVNRQTAEIRANQARLIQSEKMASLGELTAGIAHEIQNPLNFVNNFSDVNREMLAELQEELDKGDIEEAKAIAIDIEQNEQKINHHGKRADAIVKGMLQHSKSGSGAKEPTNINALADEYLRLAYHGLRSKDKSFNADLVTNFDENPPKVNVIPQDIGRVLLNLFNNAFYAVNQKHKTIGGDYKPEVSVTTSSENGQIVIKVRDNGTGIPDAVKEKIMQPFFTTKPTGEGTGLGLSLTYDMVVKGHGGKIDIDTKEGEFTEFIVYLPWV